MDALATRIQSTQDLLDICNGQRLVFGCILLSSESLAQMMESTLIRKKVARLFTLGMQIEPLMKLSNTSEFIQIMSGVFTESQAPNRFTQLIKTKLNGEDNESKEILSSYPPYDYDYVLVMCCFLETMVNLYTILDDLSLSITVLNDFLQLIDKTVAKTIHTITLEIERIASISIRDEMLLI